MLPVPALLANKLYLLLDDNKQKKILRDLDICISKTMCWRKLEYPLQKMIIIFQELALEGLVVVNRRLYI